MVSRPIIASILGLGASIHLEDRSRSFLSLTSETEQRDGFDMNAEASAELRETLQAFASDLLAPNQAAGMATVDQGIKAISGKMDVKQAIKTIEHRDLPSDVRALVTTASQSGGKGSFDEASLGKARIALNDLVEKDRKSVV